MMHRFYHKRIKNLTEKTCSTIAEQLKLHLAEQAKQILSDGKDNSANPVTIL